MLDRSFHFRLLIVESRTTGLPILDCLYFDVVWLLGLGAAVKPCDNDRGHVLVGELEESVENPRTTIGT